MTSDSRNLDAPELEARQPAGLEPVEHGRRRERQEVGELGGGEESLAHRSRRPLSELLERVGSLDLRSEHWVTGAVPGGRRWIERAVGGPRVSLERAVPTASVTRPVPARPWRREEPPAHAGANLSR